MYAIRSYYDYDVGLPRKDKDGDNYDLIEAVKDVVGAPSATEIADMDSRNNFV